MPLGCRYDVEAAAISSAMLTILRRQNVDQIDVSPVAVVGGSISPRRRKNSGKGTERGKTGPRASEESQGPDILYMVVAIMKRNLDAARGVPFERTGPHRYAQLKLSRSLWTPCDWRLGAYQ
jgi:hypothetical protein